MTQVSEIILAFGANLPCGASAPRETIESAVKDLEAQDIDLNHVSSWYETRPVPATGQPNFVNMVAAGTTSLSPEQLMERCAAVEVAHGRARNSAVRWDARTLDIDILAYSNLVLPDLKSWHAEAETDGAKAAPSALTIPHPRIHRRAFVLVPLIDVAPTCTHPVLGLTYEQLLQLHTEHHPDDVKNVQKLG